MVHLPLSGHMLAQFEYQVNQNLEQDLESASPENRRTEHEHDLPHSPAGGTGDLRRGHGAGAKAHAGRYHLYGLFHYHVRGVVTLESPDLAITEAAVGAGITGILFFLTLRRIDLIDKDAEHEARREEEPHDETL